MTYHVKAFTHKFTVRLVLSASRQPYSGHASRNPRRSGLECGQPNLHNVILNFNRGRALMTFRYHKQSYNILKVCAVIIVTEIIWRDPGFQTHASNHWGTACTEAITTESQGPTQSTLLSPSIWCTVRNVDLLLTQLRAALAEKEDLEMQNSLLQKRLDKSKTPTTRGSFAKWLSQVTSTSHLAASS